MLANGTCGCLAGYKANEFGICQECNVSGCRMCAADDANTCVDCDSSTAYIKNGQCACATSLYGLQLNNTTCAQVLVQ